MTSVRGSTVLAGVLPNVVGAIVGCGCLLSVSLRQVEPPLVDAHWRALFGYLSLVFSLAGVVFGIRAMRLSRRLGRLNADGAKGFELVALQRQLIVAPAVAAGASALGWMFGIPFFPIFIRLTLGHVLPLPILIHNIVFAALAALIGSAFTSIFVRQATLRLQLP
jgi:hypothetical protein